MLRESSTRVAGEGELRPRVPEPRRCGWQPSRRPRLLFLLLSPLLISKSLSNKQSHGKEKSGCWVPCLGARAPSKLCAPCGRWVSRRPKAAARLRQQPRAHLLLSRGRARGQWDSHEGFAAPRPARSYGRRHLLLPPRRWGLCIDFFFFPDVQIVVF